MTAILDLPPSKHKGDREALESILDDMISAGIAERNIHQVGWWVTEAFIQGVREFYAFNYESGEIEISYESEDGEMHLRWDEPMTKIQTEIGRLSRLDTSPMCRKRHNSLDSLRNASIGQVVLDNIFTGPRGDLLKLRFLTGLVLYGTYGIATWRNNASESPMATVDELIPPWELLSVPAGINNPTDLRGVIRTRLFPLEQLLKMKGVRIPDETSEDLEIVDLTYGTNASEQQGHGVAFSGGVHDVGRMYDDPAGSRSQAGRGSGGQRTERFVKLRELFVAGPDDTLARYIAKAGRSVIKDVSHMDRQERVPFPIGIGRYQDTNHFYGRSLASKIIPISLELEHLLERLIQNMADLDRFGFIMVPNSLGIDLEDFKATDGPRVITYEAELAATAGQKVDAIQPINTSDVPGKVMQFGVGLIDRIAAQGPMFGGVAPGRADSGEAFSVLAETGSTHLLPVALSIEAAYASMYRSALYTVRERLMQTGGIQGGLEITRVENSIAGVTIDPVTGRMRLEASMMPDPASIEVGIRSRDPVSGQRRRQEAPAMLQSGLLTPLEFMVMNYREGWDFPIGNRSVWENYVKAVMFNLILFNDGIKPGVLPGAREGAPHGIFFNESCDKPEVHLLAMEDFMAGPEFALASDAVLDAFYERQTTMKQRVQSPLPAGAPTLMQAAAMGAAGQGQAA